MRNDPAAGALKFYFVSELVSPSPGVCRGRRRSEQDAHATMTSDAPLRKKRTIAFDALGPRGSV
jgi:hypothetical protein